MTSTPYDEVYQRLLDHCGTWLWPAPWRFLPPPVDGHGPVIDPASALAALCLRFGPRWLRYAGVLERLPHGATRLRAELCHPLGTIVPLRRDSAQPVHALLTPRGCLPAGRNPLVAQLECPTLQRQLREPGVLFGCWRVVDLLVLRALGLPAILCLGLGRVAPYLSSLDRAFAAADFDDGPTGRPALALMRHSLTEIAASPASVAAPQALATPAASRLLRARRHLGWPLLGVQVWDPPLDIRACLRTRVAMGDAQLVRELLVESTEYLEDLSFYGDEPEGTPTEMATETLAEVESHLRTQLMRGRSGASLESQIQEAQDRYDRVIERDLVAPLRDWALDHDDNVVRNLGIELASVCRLLHGARPLVHELFGQHLAAASVNRSAPAAPALIDNYLRLSRRLGELVRDLRSWRRWL